MHIEIKSRGFEMTPGLRNYIMRRFTRPLDFARGRAHRASVYLTDENGPRGGVDKRCRIAITLNGRSPLVIWDTQEDMYQAIDRAAKRAVNALSRRMAHARRKRQRGPRHARTQFALQLGDADDATAHDAPALSDAAG